MNDGIINLTIKKLAIAIAFLLISTHAQSQSKKPLHDSVYVNQLIASAYGYWNNAPKKGLEIGQRALHLADSLNNLESRASALNVIGISYWSLGGYEPAFKSFFQALQIAKMFKNQSLYTAIEHNLALVNEDIGNFDLALFYFKRNMEWYKEHSRYEDAARVYNNIGSVFYLKGAYDSALTNYNSSLTLLRKNDDNELRWSIYLGMGQAKFKMRRLSEAQQLCDKALEHYKNTTEKSELIECLILRGSILTSLKKYNLASQNLISAKTLAFELGFNNLFSEALESISTLELVQNNFKDALTNYRNSVSLRDSISNIKRRNAFERLMVQYETEHKTQENNTLKQQAKVKEQELQKSRIIVILAIVGFLMATFSAILFFSGLRTKQKAYNELKRLNEEVEEQKKKLQEANEKYFALNNSLENLVAQRTEKIELQNQKLIEYGFFNSHEIRGPVARIKGLLHLAAIDKKLDSKALLAMLQESSEELDKKIGEMNLLLEQNSF